MFLFSVLFSEDRLDQLMEFQKDEKPSQQLLKLLAPLVPNPEAFGVQLGYKERQVCGLQGTSESRESQTLNVLQAWARRRKNRPTVGKLLHALEELGVPEQAYRAVMLHHYGE